jgi:hypothetical protein
MRLEQEGSSGLAIILDDGSRHVVGEARLEAYDEPGFNYEGTASPSAERPVTAPEPEASAVYSGRFRINRRQKSHRPRTSRAIAESTSRTLSISPASA